MNGTIAACLLLLLPLARPQESSGTALERALDSVRAENVKADLYFFADDEMEGRDTPSRGLSVAADFLRARLERIGFLPGGVDGYFHTYSVAFRRLDPERSRLVIAGGAEPVALDFGKDFTFATTKDVRDLELSAALVYCGEGDKDDLASIDLRGKVALCRGSDLTATRRRRNLDKTGAVAVFVLPPGETDPFLEEYARATEYALRGTASLGEPVGGETKLAQMFLSRAAARALLAAVPVPAPSDASETKGGSSAGEDGLPAVGQDLGLRVEGRIEGLESVLVPNVCGFWPGSDPVLSKEVILVSAHYDHVGLEDGAIHNGADDNASGSMGLLAVAEALATAGPLRRSVMCLWVSGEEKGLWGSEQWTKHPSLPEGYRPICNLNIDMIGRNAPDYLLITPSQARPEYNDLTRIAQRVAPLEGFPRLGSCDEYWARSDHKNFAENLKIPVAFLFSDVHEDYHEPGDDPEKIDYDKVRRVARVIVRMIFELQEDGLDLAAKR
jgi:hypothetical protein